MKNNHDQFEKFDSLRAGLRVEDVDFKDTGTPKLIDRENTYWRRIVDSLEEGVNSDRSLCNQLRIRRRQVLSGHYTRKRDRGLPRFAVGAAAGIAVFIGVTAWWNPVANTPRTHVTRTASLDSTNVDNSDFSNNIDFYTWLEKQSDTVADSGGS
ncbi:MAG: hypothetical protein WB783_15110 [Arenicellales bacterium]